MNVVGLDLVEARTVATTVLVFVGLYLVLALEATGRRRAMAVGGLVGAMAILYLATIAWGGTRDFFELAVPGFWSVVAILGGTGLAIAGLVLTDERFVPRVNLPWRFVRTR